MNLLFMIKLHEHSLVGLITFVVLSPLSYSLHIKFGNTHCPSSRIEDILALPEFAKVIEGVGLK